MSLVALVHRGAAEGGFWGMPLEGGMGRSDEMPRRYGLECPAPVWEFD